MNKFKLQVNSAKVSGTHTDYPAYVDLSQMPASFWNTVSNGGGDIRCYSDEALTTQLPREVVSCDTATNTGELHVKTGMTTTTEIYITVDGTSTEPAASSTYGSQNVWNSNYRAVYHLKDANDSTSNANNGTVSGATSGATGKIGSAYSFDGVNDYIDLNINSYDLGIRREATYQALINVNPQGTYRNDILSDWNSSLGISLGVYKNGIFEGYVYPGDYRAKSDPSAVPLNIFASIYVVLDTTKLRLYVNGSEIKNVDLSGDVGDSAKNLRIGSRGDGASNFFYRGIIDEIRILNTAFSADYITTEYNNQSDVSTFWTITDVTPSGTMIKRYNGTAWEAKPLKRYNGSEWENITIKRYNGSTWDNL